MLGVIWENQGELMKYMYPTGTTSKATTQFKHHATKEKEQQARNFISINSDPSSTFFKAAFKVFRKKTFCAIWHDEYKTFNLKNYFQ